MATRKEQKEQLRKDRLEAEKRSQAEARKRLMLGYVVAGILAAVIVVGIVIAIASGGGTETEASANLNLTYGILPDGVTVDDREGTPPPAVQTANLDDAAKAAGCELQLGLPDEGNTHLTQGDPLPDYKTNPPTSGNHYENPLADGAFANTPSPGNYVHALEHGRIEIQYSSDLSEADQLALKGVFDADRRGVILFPNDDMPYEIATTAWTNLMGCKKYEGDATLDAIRDFTAQFRGNGPENIPF
jgi:hypothetical protein